MGASDSKKPRTDNVERFLSMERFDSKGKLGDLGIADDYFCILKEKNSNLCGLKNGFNFRLFVII